MGQILSHLLSFKCLAKSNGHYSLSLFLTYQGLNPSVVLREAIREVGAHLLCWIYMPWLLLPPVILEEVVRSPTGQATYRGKVIDQRDVNSC